MRVLVIDDDEHVRTFVSRALERAGHVVHLASNGQKIPELLRTLEPELILTDVFMPEVDGFEALAILRAKAPRIPVIAISGGSAALDDPLHVATMLGASAVLQKPITTHALLEAIRIAIETKTARERAAP